MTKETLTATTKYGFKRKCTDVRAISSGPGILFIHQLECVSHMRVWSGLVWSGLVCQLGPIRSSRSGSRTNNGIQDTRYRLTVSIRFV